MHAACGRGTGQRLPGAGACPAIYLIYLLYLVYLVYLVYLASAFSASLIPSLTPTSLGRAFSAAAASLSL